MHTILIIEDDPSIRTNLVDLVDVHGYAAIAAVDGMDGLEKVRHHHPDLILCDVMMPRLNGLQVLDAVRADEAIAGIPFIFLTAKADAKDLREGMSQGADDYLTKPFQAAELFAAIDGRLERFNQIEQKQKRRMDELHRSVSQIIPHELRTPLVTIEGFTSLVLDEQETLSGDQIEDMLDEVLSATERLKRLVERNALFAQVTTEVAQGGLPNQTIEAAALVPAEAQARAVEHARTEDLVVSAHASTIQMRESLFACLVTEVTDNAFKFSEPGTPVRVSGTLTEDGYTLTVTDEGHGMSPRQIKVIDAYRQFDRDYYEQQGAGLGLALCQEICAAVGGTLGVQSSRGRGTSVHIAIPVTAVVSSAQPATPTAAHDNRS